MPGLCHALWASSLTRYNTTFNKAVAFCPGTHGAVEQHAASQQYNCWAQMTPCAQLPNAVQEDGHKHYPLQEGTACLVQMYFSRNLSCVVRGSTRTHAERVDSVQLLKARPRTHSKHCQIAVALPEIPKAQSQHDPQLPTCEYPTHCSQLRAAFPAASFFRCRGLGRFHVGTAPTAPNPCTLRTNLAALRSLLSPPLLTPFAAAASEHALNTRSVWRPRWTYHIEKKGEDEWPAPCTQQQGQGQHVGVRRSSMCRWPWAHGTQHMLST